jgi:hypothetical protein
MYSMRCRWMTSGCFCARTQHFIEAGGVTPDGLTEDRSDGPVTELTLSVDALAAGLAAVFRATERSLADTRQPMVVLGDGASTGGNGGDGFSETVDASGGGNFAGKQLAAVAA